MKNNISSRRKLLWTALFFVIAAATIWAVISYGKAFSAVSFISYIAETSKGWLLAAVLCMLCFVVFEGEAVTSVCRAFGYSAKHKQGFIYSASDIYFSAITPSASGGQPACAYFMIKDGIPASVTALALLLNLTMYTLSILVINLFVVIVHPVIFMSFGLLSKILIILGFVIQGLLALLFFLLLTKGKLLHYICSRILHFLCSIKFLKHEEKKQLKLDRYMSEYEEYSEMIKNHKRAVLNAFLFNMLQRISIISVPLFVYLAAGGNAAQAAQIWSLQSLVVIGSNTVPIPGAMGVSDYIMLDGLGDMMPYQNAVNFELLSRSLSFYVCVILCGAAVLIKYSIQKRSEKKT